MVLFPHGLESRKLELSTETLRCLDDQDLTDVAGGGGKGGGENNNSFIWVSAQQANSCVCQSVACDILRPGSRQHEPKPSSADDLLQPAPD
jgi:hypothetical protein